MLKRKPALRIAEVLTEALPYIQRFTGSTIIIKLEVRRLPCCELVVVVVAGAKAEAVLMTRSSTAAAVAPIQRNLVLCSNIMMFFLFSFVLLSQFR